MQIDYIVGNLQSEDIYNQNLLIAGSHFSEYLSVVNNQSNTCICCVDLEVIMQDLEESRTFENEISEISTRVIMTVNSMSLHIDKLSQMWVIGSPYSNFGSETNLHISVQKWSRALRCIQLWMEGNNFKTIEMGKPPQGWENLSKKSLIDIWQSLLCLQSSSIQNVGHFALIYRYTELYALIVSTKSPDI